MAAIWSVPTRARCSGSSATQRRARVVLPAPGRPRVTISVRRRGDTSIPASPLDAWSGHGGGDVAGYWPVSRLPAAGPAVERFWTTRPWPHRPRDYSWSQAMYEQWRLLL